MDRQRRFRLTEVAVGSWPVARVSTVCFASLSSLLFALPANDICKEHQQWLDEGVVHIISEQERSEFQKLESHELRQRFVENFWELRDPDRSTEINEFRVEHEQRTRYANERFHEGLQGWRTDRGRVYIRHGPPDDIRFVFGGDALRVDIRNPTEVIAGAGWDSRRPYRLELVRPETEIWIYRHLDGARNFPTYFQVVFSRVEPNQLYLLHKVLESVGGGANLSYGSRVARDSAIMHFYNSQRIGGPMRILYAGQYRFDHIDDLYRSVFNPLSQAMNISDFQLAMADLERSPGEVFMERLQLKRRLREEVQSRIFFEEFSLQLHYGALRSISGGTLLPVTLGVGAEYAGDSLELLVELVRADGRVIASVGDLVVIPKEIARPDEDFRYLTRLAARPGEYRLRAYGRLEKASAAAFVEKAVTLPDFRNQTMSMSDVILFDRVLARGPRSRDIESKRFLGGSQPLMLKDFMLVPAANNQFRRRQNLTAFFEIYNPRVDAELNKPDLQLSCAVGQGERRVAQMEHKSLDYFTETQADSGDVRTSYGFSIPLKSFKVGEYWLELEVHDPATGARMSRRTSFVVR